MSTPVIESIAEAIEAAVNAVTVANGFNYTLTAVRPKRIHLEGDLNADLTVIIEQDAEPEILELSNSSITYRQGFALQAIALDSDTSDEAIDTKLNKIRSDLEKQMRSTTYRTLGGLADGVLLRPPVKFTPSPQASGIAVNIDVIYTTDCNDPYTQA